MSVHARASRGSRGRAGRGALEARSDGRREELETPRSHETAPTR